MMPKRRSRALRTIGWLAVTSMLATAILGPGAGAAFANDLNQDPPISWDANGYGSGDCPKLEAGQVLWHFVQTQVDDSTASGDLTAKFHDKGEVTVESYKQSGGALHWAIITGHDTLLDAKSDVESEGPLNLSHICVGPDKSEAPSSTPSEAPSEEPSEAPSEQPSEAPSEAPSEQPSETPSETPSEAPGQAWVYVVKIVDQDGDPATDEDETFPGGWHYLVTVGGGTADPKELVTDEDTLAFTTITLDDGSATVSLEEVVQAGYNLIDAICIQEPASEVDVRALRADRLKIMQDEGIGKLEGNTLTFEVPADTITLCGFLNQPKKATATPSGGVEGATGTPKLTPPSTDSFGAGATSAPANDTWRLMLIAMAGLLATILVLTPATKKARKE